MIDESFLADDLKRKNMTAGRVRLAIALGSSACWRRSAAPASSTASPCRRRARSSGTSDGFSLTGQCWPAIAKTLVNVAAACAAAIVVGVALGTLIHRWRALRETLDPLFAAYYAIPVYAFYPLFIVIFGLGDLPQVLIGFMLGLVAVIVNTLNGLDRVPRVLLKTARMHRLGPVATALQGHRCPTRRRISSPASSSRSRIPSSA